MPGAALHLPVMAKEVVTWLQLENGGLYIDATLGLGGHSRALLEASAPDGRVIGFEWDTEAAALARENLAEFSGRIHIVQASYTRLKEELQRLGVSGVDGLIADLGVSSLQLDRAARGFSFLADAPLDMRMNQNLPWSAADLLARLTEEQLADLLYYYGEERQARRIARYLARVREYEPITRTGQLARLVAKAVPGRFQPHKTHVATKTFQALRIAVNGELDNIQTLLDAAPEVLKPGARMAIIAFHSLEDRLTKQAFSQSGLVRALTKKPIEAGEEERARNPRARSAKMRVAERC